MRALKVAKTSLLVAIATVLAVVIAQTLTGGPEVGSDDRAINSPNPHPWPRLWRAK
jgi:hypothetical protein